MTLKSRYNIKPQSTMFSTYMIFAILVAHVENGKAES